jgi:hypothetical protein
MANFLRSSGPNSSCTQTKQKETLSKEGGQTREPIHFVDNMGHLISKF